MQIHISRRTLYGLLVALVSVIAAGLVFAANREAASLPPSPTPPVIATPPSAEEWSNLFWNGPSKRTMQDGSLVIVGWATWQRRSNDGDEIFLRTREEDNYTLVIPDNASVYLAEEFFTAPYPQPTTENPRGVVARLKRTPVMVRVWNGKVTTLFVLKIAGEEQ